MRKILLVLLVICLVAGILVAKESNVKEKSMTFERNMTEEVRSTQRNNRNETVLFFEDFDSSFSLPAGWDSDGWVEVASGYGIGGSNYLELQVPEYSSSWWCPVSSATTPSIGPILPGSMLEFYYTWYCWDDDAPSAMLGSTIQILVNNITIHTISDLNHTVDADMALAEVSLEAFVGQSIQIQFLVTYGDPEQDLDYMMELDNVKVYADASSSGANAYYLNEDFNTPDWSIPADWYLDGSFIAPDFQDTSSLLLSIEISTYAPEPVAVTPMLGAIVPNTMLSFDYRVGQSSGFGTPPTPFELDADNFFEVYFDDDVLITRVVPESVTLDLVNVTIDISDFIGEIGKIAFRIVSTDGTSFRVELDNVKVYYPLAEYDLCASGISGWTLPTVNNPVTTTIRVKNMGTETASGYSVVLMNEASQVLGTATGTSPIAPDASVDFTISWTPVVSGLMNVYGVVNYVADTTPNNMTALYTMNIQIDGTLVQHVGDETSTLYTDNMTASPPSNVLQTIYLAGDIGVTGVITDLGFNFNSLGDIVGMPLSIYLAVSAQNSFPTAPLQWVPYSAFTMVWQGAFTAEQVGEYYHFFELIAPFAYSHNDGNLVVMVKKHYWPEQSYDFRNGFLTTDNYSVNRLSAMRAYDFSGDINVANLPTDWTASTSYLMTNILLRFTDVVSGDDHIVMVGKDALHANYPNPFNPSTTIAFDVVKDGNVRIDVYNVRGQKVTTLADAPFTAGSHKVIWNGNDDAGRSVSSGIYFYRMHTDGYSAVKRMVLMK